MLPQAQARPVQAQAVQQNDTVPRAVHEEVLQRLQETEERLRQQRIENDALVASSGLPRILNLYVKILKFVITKYIS